MDTMKYYAAVQKEEVGCADKELAPRQISYGAKYWVQCSHT